MKDIKNKQLLVVLLVAAVVGTVTFFGGMKYQQSKQLSGFRIPAGGMMAQQGNRQQAGGNGRGNAANGIRPVVGEILSMDDKSITVKLQDGSSKIVLLPETTTYSKTDTGSKTDLKVGGKVGVFGTVNTDGSVTAQTVQENPSFGALGAGLMRTNVATPTPTAK